MKQAFLKVSFYPLSDIKISKAFYFKSPFEHVKKPFSAGTYLANLEPNLDNLEPNMAGTNPYIDNLEPVQTRMVDTFSAKP